MLLLALAAFCAVPTACSDDDDPASTEKTDPDNPDNPDTPDTPVTSQYPAIGDAFGSVSVYGTNSETNPTAVLLEAALRSEALEGLEFDDEYNAIGADGTGVYIQFYFVIPYPEDGQISSIPEGTYTYKEEDYNVNSVPAAWYIAAKNNEVLADVSWASGSTMKITDTGGYLYKFDFDLYLANGEHVEDSCTVDLTPNNSDYSTLTGDITISNLEVGVADYYGSWYPTLGDQVADMMYLYLTDGVNDGQYYTGNYFQFLLNVTPGSKTAIPAGSYNTWLDLFTSNVTYGDLVPFSTMAGFVDNSGYIAGAWYTNDTEDEMVRIVGGSLEVSATGSTYKITGAVEDYQGYTIDFTYEGEIKFIDNSTSTTSSIKKNGMGMNRVMPKLQKSATFGTPTDLPIRKF